MSLTASPPPETAAPTRRPHAGALSKSSLRHAGDDRLVALTRGGSERAFAEIMRRYQRPLQFYCLHMVGAPRAEDAVQQAFMQAFVALRDGERREIALRPWLYRIARNCAIDILRKQPIEHDELDPEFDGTAQPPGLLEQKEELARVVAAIQALPERQRRALTLRELEGRSYGEISAELGHTDSGVRQLIFRARTALRNLGAWILPVGSARWKVLGSPSAGTDQIVAAASTPSGGSSVAHAAASVFVATLALIGAGASDGRRQGDRAAAPQLASVAQSRPSPAGVDGAGHAQSGIADRSDAARGGAGGVAPALILTASGSESPGESSAGAAGAEESTERATPEPPGGEEPQPVSTQDVSPDTSTGGASNSGSTGASGPASPPSDGAATAPESGPPSDPDSSDGGGARPVVPSVPTPPTITPPKTPAPPKPIVPRRPLTRKPSPRSAAASRSIRNRARTRIGHLIRRAGSQA